MIRCLIIEDEIMSRKSLVKLCEKVDSLELIGEFDDGNEALELIKKSEIDLIFLDIEMPKISGIELLEKLPYLPQIIFTTSNKEYAFAAFEYDVTDFLKKPISTSRFIQSIEKVKLRKQQLEAVTNSSAKSEIYIKVEGRLIRIPYSEIFYFENVGDYIKVISSLGNFVFYGTIKSLDQRIMNPRFLKVHRSYIINLDKIKDIEDNTLVINNKVIPISRAHKPILMRSLNLI